MTNYIKICPICGAFNPESAQACKKSDCNAFLDGVEAVPEPYPEKPEQPFGEGKGDEEAAPSELDPDQLPLPENLQGSPFKLCPQCGARNSKDSFLCATPGCNTSLAFVEAVLMPEGSTNLLPRRLYLENPHLPHPLEVKSGQVVGQAHPTSGADVKLSGIPDIECVSRSHCRFDFDGSSWMLTALPTTTNKTCVNGKVIPKGQSVALKNGDVVTMAICDFRVRLME
ncbi:FHA domain-containing protein [Desulforhabdus sp. TSK]|uniref:FHA domain-containing protein n=1 Tax=Desulforhabdus sp. TSK TaxID=2925014 RepID=UPI001FC8C8EC|nr:FHA domain-containing protein [Desulforhabdus sp. TSK]GKT09133.1 hypothetical protein DSTSK_24380 [Desulforhabdus sp. TSK]